MFMSAPAKDEDYRMPKTLPAGASSIVRIAFCCWLTRLLTKVRSLSTFDLAAGDFSKESSSQHLSLFSVKLTISMDKSHEAVPLPIYIRAR